MFDGIKQGVRGDRRTYLAGLLSDVFFDAKRPATNPVTPANHHARGLPTLQVYAGGELVKAFKCAKPKSVLLKAMEEYL